MQGESVPDSTLDGVAESETTRRARWVMRVFVALLTLVVAASLAQFLGVYTGTVTSAGGGYRMRLLYPEIARPGLDVTWKLTVTEVGGLRGPITIAISGDYFDNFETQAFYPTPSTMRRNGQYVYMTFPRPPGGRAFVLTYDTYVQPYTDQGRSAVVAVSSGTQFLDSVAIHTWLAP